MTNNNMSFNVPLLFENKEIETFSDVLTKAKDEINIYEFTSYERATDLFEFLTKHSNIFMAAAQIDLALYELNCSATCIFNKNETVTINVSDELTITHNSNLIASIQLLEFKSEISKARKTIDEASEIYVHYSVDKFDDKLYDVVSEDHEEVSIISLIGGRFIVEYAGLNLYDTECHPSNCVGNQIYEEYDREQAIRDTALVDFLWQERIKCKNRL